MKISLKLIQKFTSVDLPVEALVAKIGAQLGAVEEVIDLRQKHYGIEVVKIIEAKPHPNADRLNVYQMTNGREEVQVVSGDSELNVGDKVAWIAPGQTVPSTKGTSYPVVMEAREMRGEMSNGMFASGKELDINDDHQRVLKLDTDAAPGTLLAEAYELDDVIIDIENKMFTHRPDCFGVIGVAREIAGIQGRPFHSPQWYLLEAGGLLRATAEPLSVKVQNEIPMLVPAYNVAIMRDVRVQPSPILIQSHLKRVGIRPINNVVDITNYLMYVSGQPLHAFDYDKVAALDNAQTAELIIRLPHQGETLTLLDGKTIEPHSQAMLIASRHHAIGLGGIMGGANSEVDEHTRTIIIESAHFDMFAIRRTSMIHGIFSDAATRFSKGQSREQARIVLAKAVTLMGEHANANLATELGIEAPLPAPPIKTNVQFINDRLGSQLHAAEIKKLLTNVEMSVHVHQDQLTITPPFWRTDLEIAEDIVEEVGRLHGYGELPHELPLRPSHAVTNPSIEALKTAISTTLATAGNNELQTYSFIPAKLLEKTGQDDKPAYRLRNALSPELQLIRTSLLPSLLEKVHPNHKAGFDDFGMFEIGKSHNKHDIGDDQLPREHIGLSYIFSAEKKAAKDYHGSPFYQAKKHLAYLLSELQLQNSMYQPLHSASFDEWWLQNIALLFEPKRAAVIVINGLSLGVIGEFRQAIKRNFKLPSFVSGFELDLLMLHGINRPASAYQPLLRFPSTEQDICFKIPKMITYSDVLQLIEKSFVDDERLRVTITPVDIYQRENDIKHKQITFRINLQHHDRTLTTSEVNVLIDRLVLQAANVLRATKV